MSLSGCRRATSMGPRNLGVSRRDMQLVWRSAHHLALL